MARPLTSRAYNATCALWDSCALSGAVDGGHLTRHGAMDAMRRGSRTLRGGRSRGGRSREGRLHHVHAKRRGLHERFRCVPGFASDGVQDMRINTAIVVSNPGRTSIGGRHRNFVRASRCRLRKSAPKMVAAAEAGAASHWL